jgi:hypothetical protein
MVEVKVGQIWKDNDKRVGDRRVRIAEITDDKAKVVNLETGKTSKIAIKRFKPNSTGYTLIKDT